MYYSNKVLSQRSFVHGRKIVSTFLSLLLFVQPVLISGCSSDSNPLDPPEAATPPIETMIVEGAVNNSHIGGNSISVFSVWDEPKDVPENGVFNLTVSRTGAQLLMARDGNGDIRGLSISVPVEAGAVKANLLFDAESTALAMLMSTPGITAVEPVAARERLEVLRGLPHFPELVEHLGTHLTESTLGEAQQSQEVQAAFAACHTDWFSRDSESKGDGDDEGLKEITGYAARIKNSDNPELVEIEMRNFAWRFLNVHRRELDSEGTEIAVVPVYDGENSMGGGSPLNLYDLFHARYGLPTDASDFVDMRSEGCIAKVEYWITGLGWGDIEAIIPQDTDLLNQYDISDVAGKSLIKYVVLPYLSFVFGMSGIMGAPDSVITELYSLVAPTLNAQAMINAQSQEALGIATFNQFQAFLRLLPSIAQHMETPLFGIQISYWQQLGFFLNLVDALISTINLGVVIAMWWIVPKAAMVSIPVPWDVEPCEPDTIPPADVSDLRMIGYTRESLQLAWTTPGDDGNEGQASQTDIRYSDQNFGFGDWSSLIDPSGESYPPRAGNLATFTIGGLTPDTWYYFAVLTADREENESGLSNICRAKIPGETGPITWTPSVNLTVWNQYQWNCWTRYSGGPDCSCPPESSVEGWFPDGGIKGFPPILMTVDGDHISGSLGIQGPYGFFTLAPGLVEIEGTLNGDFVDFTMHVTGSLSDDWLDPIFDPAGNLDLTVTVNNASITGQSINGNCSFAGTARSDGESCVALTRVEGGGGSVTVQITEVVGPICSMNPWYFDFSEVAIGQTAERSLEVSNSGGGILEGNFVTTSEDYSIISGAGPFQLENDQSRTITVQFSPQTEGDITCSFDTGLESCSELVCIGRGVGPECLLEPGILEFEDLDIGMIDELGLSITNMGTGTLSGHPQFQSGPFRVVIGDGPFSLGPGESWFLTVEFAPESEGEAVSNLTFGSSFCDDVQCIGTGQF